MLLLAALSHFHETFLDDVNRLLLLEFMKLKSTEVTPVRTPRCSAGMALVGPRVARGAARLCGVVNARK